MANVKREVSILYPSPSPSGLAPLAQPSISENTLSPRTRRFLRDTLQFIITQQRAMPPSFPGTTFEILLGFSSASRIHYRLPCYFHFIVIPCSQAAPTRCQMMRGWRVIPRGIDRRVILSTNFAQIQSWNKFFKPTIWCFSIVRQLDLGVLR